MNPVFSCSVFRWSLLLHFLLFCSVLATCLVYIFAGAPGWAWSDGQAWVPYSSSCAKVGSLCPTQHVTTSKLSSNKVFDYQWSVLVSKKCLIVNYQHLKPSTKKNVRAQLNFFKLNGPMLMLLKKKLHSTELFRTSECLITKSFKWTTFKCAKSKFERYFTITQNLNSIYLWTKWLAKLCPVQMKSE